MTENRDNTTAALVPISVGASVDLAELEAAAVGYIGASRAPSTIRAYGIGWRHFQDWAFARGLCSIPAGPETVALYLSDIAGTRATGTLGNRLAAITWAHRQAGYDTPATAPVVRATWQGIRRTFGVAQIGKAPARTADVRRMVKALDLTRTIGLRDRALLVVGFAGAFRRSELVALDVADVTEEADGLRVLIRRSKTDQEGAGATVGLPWGSDPLTCPVRAVRDWRAVGAIESGPLFRAVDRGGVVAPTRLSAQTVARVVKRTARAAGLDEAALSAHSLRAGLITSAAEADVPERRIMDHSRHKSIAVMRRYIRDVGIFDENAAAAVGL